MTICRSTGRGGPDVPSIRRCVTRPVSASARCAKFSAVGSTPYRMKGESFDDGYQNVPVNGGLSSPRKQSFFKLLSEITGEKP